MKSIIVLSENVKAMSPEEVINYECHYFDETVALEVSGVFIPNPCEDCGFIVDEPDIFCAYCPADFDYKDLRCPKSFKYVALKRYLIEADLLLRNTIGDVK